MVCFSTSLKISHLCFYFCLLVCLCFFVFSALDIVCANEYMVSAVMMMRVYVSAPLIRSSASVDAISIVYVWVRDMGGIMLFFERVCMRAAMWGRRTIVVSVMKPMFVGMFGFRVMPVKMSMSFRRFVVLL